MYGPTSLLNFCPTPDGARGNIDAAPASLGGQNPGNNNKTSGQPAQKEIPRPTSKGAVKTTTWPQGNQLERKNHAQPRRVRSKQQQDLRSTSSKVKHQQRPRRTKQRSKQTQKQQETGIKPATPPMMKPPLTTTLSLRFSNNNKNFQIINTPNLQGWGEQNRLFSGIYFLCLHQNTSPF